MKESSKEMVNPQRGAWKIFKKVAKYMVRRKIAVWHYKWKDEPELSYTLSDSEWGGNMRDRKSTSGGVWFRGCSRSKRGHVRKAHTR